MIEQACFSNMDCDIDKQLFANEFYRKCFLLLAPIMKNKLDTNSKNKCFSNGLREQQILMINMIDQYVFNCNKCDSNQNNL